MNCPKKCRIKQWLQIAWIHKFSCKGCLWYKWYPLTNGTEDITKLWRWQILCSICAVLIFEAMRLKTWKFDSICYFFRMILIYPIVNCHLQWCSFKIPIATFFVAELRIFVAFRALHLHITMGPPTSEAKTWLWKWT